MDVGLRYATDGARRTALRSLYPEAHDRPTVARVGRTSTLSADGPLLVGASETLPDDLYGHVIRRDLLLHDRDTDEPILQRLVPRSRDRHLDLLAYIKVGRQRFDRVLEYCKVHKTASQRETAGAPATLPAASAADHGTLLGAGNETTHPAETEDAIEEITYNGLDHNGHYHFGVWYGQGGTYATTSSDTRQDTDLQSNERVLRFMTWLRKYVTLYVEPLVNTTTTTDRTKQEPRNRLIDAVDQGREGIDNKQERRSLIVDRKFRANLSRRKEDYEWLCKEVPIARDLCHKYYNVCSPFQGFSGKAHRDTGDSAPTVLLNFGFARLHLPGYDLQVDLRPGEVVLFDACVEHYTSPHPGYPGPDSDRWAVSCFFQKRLHDHWRPKEYPKNLDLHRRVLVIQRQDDDPERAEGELREAEEYMRTRTPLQQMRPPAKKSATPLSATKSAAPRRKSQPAAHRSLPKRRSLRLSKPSTKTARKEPAGAAVSASTA